MKKIFGFLVVATLIFGATSCKKNYTCECITGTGAAQIKTEYEFENVKRKEAKEACDKHDAKVLGVVTECELK